MDKVLKRVGLSRRSDNSTLVTSDKNAGGADNSSTNKATRRRRRSKSRRRATTNDSGEGVVKSRGVFNIDWSEYVKECKPSCRPRAITKRFCRGRRTEDNELYRSNSFKFERFVRGKEDTSTIAGNTLEKQVRCR